MEKIDVIKSVIEMADRIRDLECQNTNLRNRIIMMSESNSGIHGHIYEAGRKAIVDLSIEKYSYVYIDGNGKPDSFDDWFKSFVSVPSWCSRDDFIEEFGEELMDVYGRDVDAAWERKKIVSSGSGEGDGEAEAQVQG